MKNIYLTIAFMISILFVSAQTLTVGPELTTPQSQKAAITKAVKAKSNSKDINSRWYNYATTVDEFYGGVSSMERNYLFPDSNILADFAGTADGTPWIHSIATVIDPKSEYFQIDGQQLITNTTPYSVDSATMYTKYYRATDASIYDTLRFEFFTSDNVSSYLFTGMADDYFSDTVIFVGIPRIKVSVNATKIVVDYILSESDTASDPMTGFNIYSVAVAGLNVSAGEVAGVTATFIPGYSYTDTDTLNTKNYMSFYSYEEQGENTYPTYFPGEDGSSQVVSINDLDPTSGWGDLYVPSWAWGQTYGFENHLIEMRITADAEYTSIESTTNNGLKVNQNNPNPFNDNTNISYNLTEASNVNVSIYNVAGAKVMDLNQGMQSVGSHNLSIDGSSLQAGVYFYTFTANNNTVTKKMIVY